MDLSKLLADVNNFVWGPVMLVLLVGTGIFLTVRLKFLPWRNLGYAIHMVFSKRDKHAGDISPFQSLITWSSRSATSTPVISRRSSRS